MGKLALLAAGTLLCAQAAFAGSDAPAKPPETLALPAKISAFVNGSKDVGVFRGWPIVMKVSVDHPQTAEAGKTLEPITLASEKDWTDLLSVRVLDAEKKPMTWDFDKSLLAKTGPKLVLDGSNGAFVAFLISPKNTGKIAAGNYELSVVLKNDERAHSAPVKVKMMDHPAKLSAKGEAARDRLSAMYHALKGDKQEAVQIVEKIKYVQVPAEPQPAQPMYMTTGPAYTEQPNYEPQSNGGAELLSIIAALGFEDQIPSIDSIEDIETETIDEEEPEPDPEPEPEPEPTPE